MTEQKCVSGTIDVGNIGTSQKYNWNTLRTKGNHIGLLDKLDGMILAKFLEIVIRP